ncbi:tail fiber protein [Paenibacillus enshidis]|uniref:tail fiber protein n=1 Tax=Paenibacillus enshidis TaxID=1458439 RepID=UPI004055692B
MASDTERLKLLKKDPLTDGNETFNIQTMLNDNWDKLDEAVGILQDEIANMDPDIPEGSITQKGIVQLSSATNSTSEILAATPKAVKAAYDLANTANTAASNAQSTANTANSTATTAQSTANSAKTTADSSLPKAGGTISGSLAVNNQLMVKYNGISNITMPIGDSDTGLHWIGDGGIDFYSNNQVPVALKNQDFLFKNTAGIYESLKTVINNLQTKVEVGAVKSIQRYTATIPKGSSTTLVTISAVNTANTILNFLGTYSDGYDAREGDIAIQLISSTTVSATRGWTTSNTTVSFEVVTYN